jgi:hypothetical protein
MPQWTYDSLSRPPRHDGDAHFNTIALKNSRLSTNKALCMNE